MPRVLDGSAAFGRNDDSTAAAKLAASDARLLDAAIALSELKSGIGILNAPMRTATKRDLERESQKEYCRCTKSKCLMLYCSCFRKQVLCTKDCLCTQCKNNVENDGERKLVTTRKLGNGCKCKKNNCLKKYCDCLRDGFYCSDSCACLLCLNVFKPDESKHDKLAQQPEYFGRDLPKTSNAVGGISAMLAAQSSGFERMAIFWKMDAPMLNIPSASSAFTVVHPQQ